MIRIAWCWYLCVRAFMFDQDNRYLSPCSFTYICEKKNCFVVFARSSPLIHCACVLISFIFFYLYCYYYSECDHSGSWNMCISKNFIQFSIRVNCKNAFAIFLFLSRSRKLFILLSLGWLCRSAKANCNTMDINLLSSLLSSEKEKLEGKYKSGYANVYWRHVSALIQKPFFVCLFVELFLFLFVILNFIFAFRIEINVFFLFKIVSRVVLDS